MYKAIHSEKPNFEYSKITGYIYIGTNWCCDLHFKSELINKGVKADISLEEERIDQPFGAEYYLWLPTKNHKAPSFKQLLIGTVFIESLVKYKIKVYVHCKNGHGRAPTLVAAYLILKGKTVDEAINLIKKKRHSIHPNKFQIKALNNFKRRLRL